MVPNLHIKDLRIPSKFLQQRYNYFNVFFFHHEWQLNDDWTDCHGPVLPALLASFIVDCLSLSETAAVSQSVWVSGQGKQQQC